MATRNLVLIDEERCNGCGQCVTACAEGAIRLVDGKARLVSEIYCDGLGACIGHCPEGAITVVPTEAKPYDEAAVAQHLAALDARGGIASLTRGAPAPAPATPAASAPVRAAAPAHGHGHGHGHGGGGCPGSRAFAFEPAPSTAPADEAGTRPSQLRQWPVQLHLVSPHAAYYRGADLLLAADCTAFAVGDFHRDHLRGHALAIACPKLDDGRETYVEKLTALFDDAQIRSLTALIMEVPCCGGLIAMAREARDRATRKLPIRVKTVDVRGDVIDDREV